MSPDFDNPDGSPMHQDLKLRRIRGVRWSDGEWAEVLRRHKEWTVQRFLAGQKTHLSVSDFVRAMTCGDPPK